jgi:hypothetical protein
VRSYPERSARAATRSLRLCSSASRCETGRLRLQKKWAWPGEDSTIAVGSRASGRTGGDAQNAVAGTKVHPQDPTQRATYRSLYHDLTEERELAFARTGKREKWGLSGVPRDESVAAR